MITYPVPSPTGIASQTTTKFHPRRVVVGVDEDPASGEALRLAFAEAAYRGADVHALHVWTAASKWGDPNLREIDKPAGDYALNKLNQVVNAVVRERAAMGEPAVAVLTEVVEGSASTELSNAARGAALLVMGKRHHNRLLGSVSQACINHPPCTVMIVPAP